jgi:hypothetical protein
MTFLESHYLPNLSSHIVTEHMIDPRHFRDNLNSYLGSAFSVEPILTQSAYFRPHNKSEELPNLYFVGAGTHPGAGQRDLRRGAEHEHPVRMPGLRAQREDVGDLHLVLGACPGLNHRMSTCCDAMFAEQREGDRVLSQSEKGKGASLTIRYKLPRPIRRADNGGLTVSRSAFAGVAISAPLSKQSCKLVV